MAWVPLQMSFPLVVTAWDKSIIWWVQDRVELAHGYQLSLQPGSYIAHDGSAVVIKNVICIHEEDAGILWKHTDFRPGGRGHAVRSRRLVVSMVCTVANYGISFCLVTPKRQY
jgi:hypothetical protein